MNLRENNGNYPLESLVISRAPFLITFGADEHISQGISRSYNPRVLSIAIGYYVYTIIAPSRIEGVQLIGDGCQILSSDSHCGEDSWGREFAFSQAIARHFGVRGGTRIFIAPQLNHAAGLGLAGSIGVSLIKGLAYACGVDLEPRDVVDLACHIATQEPNLKPGSHSQYASAFGGIGLHSVLGDRLVYEQVQLSGQTYRGLERGLMLFSIRREHGSEWAECANEDVVAPSVWGRRSLKDRTNLALDIRLALETGDLESVGNLLHRQWLEESQLVTDSNDGFLSQCYEAARHHGASGGLCNSAGDYSCLILYCREQCQRAVSHALTALGWRHWPLTLEPQGVQLLEALPWQRHSLASVVTWQRFSASDSVVGDVPMNKHD